MSGTLTPKEEQITALIAKGMKNHDIAKIIGTSTNMIKNYVRPPCDRRIGLHRNVTDRSKSLPTIGMSE